MTDDQQKILDRLDSIADRLTLLCKQVTPSVLEIRDIADEAWQISYILAVMFKNNIKL